MPVRIAHFRLAQDRAGGFVSLSLVDVSGNPGPFGPWKPIPFAAFSSLVGLLTSGPCVYDPPKDMYVLEGNRSDTESRALVIDNASFALPVRENKAHEGK